MNLSVSNNNQPTFGFAVKVDKKALPVIKEQALLLKGEKGDAFLKEIEETVARQENNPVNIIIKKVFGRNDLAAVVVDESATNAVKNKKFSQGFFSSNGDLKFLQRAEAQADRTHEINSRINQFNIAAPSDYKPAKNV